MVYRRETLWYMDSLYEAKRLGKGQARAYSESMYQSVSRRYTIAEALRAALERDETTIVVQPVVRLRDGAIVGGEALSRWDDLALGSVAPDEFVRIAEEHGLSAALSRRVIQKLVAALRSAPGQLNVSVNVSPGDLTAPDLADLLLAGAKAIRPHILGVEVTERMLISDPGVFATLAILRAGGLHVYIDDFGTGYSSLSYLKDMPADFLKIPREFVSEIESGRRVLGEEADRCVALGRVVQPDRSTRRHRRGQHHRRGALR